MRLHRRAGSHPPRRFGDRGIARRLGNRCRSARRVRNDCARRVAGSLCGREPMALQRDPCEGRDCTGATRRWSGSPHAPTRSRLRFSLLARAQRDWLSWTAQLLDHTWRDGFRRRCELRRVAAAVRLVACTRRQAGPTNGGSHLFHVKHSHRSQTQPGGALCAPRRNDNCHVLRKCIAPIGPRRTHQPAIRRLSVARGETSPPEAVSVRAAAGRSRSPLPASGVSAPRQTANASRR